MKKLREIRKRAGVTMKALGLQIGVSESTISLYESGRRCPDVQTLIRIADYFNVSLDYLCGREEVYTSREQIMDLYLQLNFEGQEKLLDYADDLVQSRKYIKAGPNRMGKEA